MFRLSEALDGGIRSSRKSDQLNTDDLIGGPPTVRITKVSRANTAEQPIVLGAEGDGQALHAP